MSADVVGGLVTAHAYDPDVAVVLATEAATGVHVTPPSRLRSTATLLPAPRLCVHAIDCVAPATHVTAVLGDVTVIVSSATVAVVVLVALALPSLTRSVTV